MNYESQICAGCGKAMHEGDDIVVCPECATPQHRECYNKLHSCVNGYLHAAGYVWQPDTIDNNAEQSVAEDNPALFRETAENDFPDGRFCPICGEKNPADATRCANCGALFSNPNQPPFGAFPPFGPNLNKPLSNPYLAGLSIDENEEIGGEKAGDIATYVRRNTRKILPKFQAFSKDEAKRFSWNWAAFFLTPYYFFYRRMAKAGFLFMGLLLTLQLCFSPLFGRCYSDSLSLYYDYSEKVAAFYEAQYNGAGTSQTDSAKTTTAQSAPSSAENEESEAEATEPAATQATVLTQEELDALRTKVSTALIEDTTAFLRNPAVWAVLIGMLLCRIFSALTADKTYYHKVLRDLGALRNRCNNEETFRAMVYRVGGASVLSLICSIFSMNFAFELLISFADRLSL